MNPGDLSSRLVERGDDPNRPSLENRVAYQWERPLDSLGGRHAHHRDEVVLGWMMDAMPAGAGKALDVGCSYGNHILMLNARLGKPAGAEFVGIDIDADGVAFGQAFAESVPGYSNCRFFVASIETRLPFDDSTFDVVNFADVIEHLEDPPAVMSEIHRVLKPGGSVIINTPLKTGIFKSAAALVNRMTWNRLNRTYYRGKGSDIDEHGHPLMHTRAGHDHISEMDYHEILDLAQRTSFKVRRTEFMAVMSGSAWFDQHPALLAALLLVEGVHRRLQRPSWAHSVCVQLVAIGQ